MISDIFIEACRMMLQNAQQCRKNDTRTGNTAFEPLLMMLNPKNVPPGVHLNTGSGGQLIVTPVGAVVSDHSNVLLNKTRAAIALMEPEAVAFWCETWVRTAPDAEKRDEALFMIIQDKEESFIIQQKFYFVDGEYIFADTQEKRFKHSDAQFNAVGRFARWIY